MSFAKVVSQAQVLSLIFHNFTLPRMSAVAKYLSL